jgi:hypothetical protein
VSFARNKEGGYAKMRHAGKMETKMLVKILLGISRRRAQLECIGVNGRIILKRILKT